MFHLAILLTITGLHYSSLHHHCNGLQAKYENGDLLYSRRCRKKAGRCIPTITMEHKEYSYVSRLLAAAMNKQQNDSGKVERHKPISEDDPRWESRTIARVTDVLVDEKISFQQTTTKKTFCTWTNGPTLYPK